jgi:hypothetical protein
MAVALREQFRLTSIATAFLLLALAGISHAAGPEHAHQVDATGWWECDRGYVMRARPGGALCVQESEAAREPQVVVSDLLSAGDGSLQTSVSARSAPRISAATSSAPSSGPLYIQTSRPWTVILDQGGNPSAVIVGGAEARPARSALFGR